MLDVFLIILFLYVEQESGHIPPAEAGPSWAAQAELSAKPACSQARQPKGQTLFPLLSSCFLWLLILSPLLTLMCCSLMLLTHPCFLLAGLPSLSHDGSQISTLCRKGRGGGEGGAVATVKKWERAC